MLSAAHDQVTTTNISQLKAPFVQQVRESHGKAIAEAADAAIRQSITCYAYVLHNMRGLSIGNGKCQQLLLDWEGREDAYDGNNRDVATLYEFWLYFELLDLLSNEVGCELIETAHDSTETEMLPFMVQVEGQCLRVNLKQGRASYCCFRYLQ